LCAAVFWYAGGKRYYTGPLVEAEIQDGEVASSSSDVEGEKRDAEHGPNTIADVQPKQHIA
jgi:hypothetical protein